MAARLGAGLLCDSPIVLDTGIPMSLHLRGDGNPSDRRHRALYNGITYTREASMPVMVIGPSSELSSWSLEFTEHCCCYHPAGPISGTGDGYRLRQMAHVISCSSRQNTPDVCVCHGLLLAWGGAIRIINFVFWCLVSPLSVVCCLKLSEIRS